MQKRFYGKFRIRHLEMFFDYLCPYCRKAHIELQELMTHYRDIVIDWYPTAVQEEPGEFTTDTEYCRRGFFLAKDQGIDLLAYHDLMYKAVHEDDIDIGDAAALAEYVAPLIDPELFQAMLESEEYKAEIEEVHRYALEQEVSILPSFRIEGRTLDAEPGVGVTQDQMDILMYTYLG